MKKFFIGSITFVLVLFNAIWIILAVTPIGLLRFLPSRRIKIGVLKFNERLGEHYLNGNKFKISGKTWIDYNENTFKSAFSVA